MQVWAEQKQWRREVSSDLGTPEWARSEVNSGLGGWAEGEASQPARGKGTVICLGTGQVRVGQVGQCHTMPAQNVIPRWLILCLDEENVLFFTKLGDD